MYLITTPWWLRMLFPGCTWQMPGSEKTVYLTFDDGPHPTATPFVLEQLQQYGARASFFCIGKNVAAYPALYQRILTEGHTTGNHTMHHLNGWKTDDTTYLKDIEAAGQLIRSRLMRPPYGRLKWSQISRIKRRQAVPPIDRIIMWSVIAADFDTRLDGEQCYRHVIRHTRPGSIIVFHDSTKAWPRLQQALPSVLQWLSSNGYQMEALDSGYNV